MARRIAELLETGEPAPARGQLISAEEVAQWWGVGRRWVYDHADELGARRLGSGRRPRLRFDPDEVAERLGEPGSGSDVRRPEAMSGDCASGSLSCATELWSGGRQKNGRGGARTPPDPAPK